MPRLFLLSLLLLAACTHHTNPIPIILTTLGDPATGEIGGMVVPVTLDREPSPPSLPIAMRPLPLGSPLLAIDTGSALTFLYTGKNSPEYSPHAGTITIGNERLDLPGRNFETDDETHNIVGVLGADFFIDTTTLFDPRAPAITRYHEGAKVTDTTGWAIIPFENVEGHIIITINVDGQPCRLMWDTGSPHILVIGEQGRPGDEESRAMGVDGAQFPMFVGPGEVTIGSEPPTARTILRAPNFPYFEGTVKSLGGNIQGLAGQSTFGLRAILFDARAGEMRVQPAE